MRRIFLALAVQAALATPILADYLVIRINLSSDAQSVNPSIPNSAQGGNVGGMSMSALKGKSGGGMTLGGKGLTPGGPGNQGGASPPAFGRAGPPGAGGAAGGRPPTLGVGSAGTGLKPGMAAGGLGAGLGGEGGSGFGGAATPPGEQAAAGELTPAKDDLFVVTTEVSVNKPRVGNKTIISHKWGATVLDPEISLPGRATMQVIKAPTLEQRFDAKRRELLENAGNKQPLQFARWMLQNWNLASDGKFSMQAKFEAFLGELNNQSASMSTENKAKVAALMSIKNQLSQPVAAAKEEMDLVRSLMPKIGRDFRPMSKGHYVIFHGPQDDRLAESKLAKLEEAMAGVLYWFALESKPLPMPTKQMVCILADSTDKFKALRNTFDNLPLKTDGFYSPQDNITVLAPQRVDPQFERFMTLANNTESTLRTHKLDFKKMLTENANKPYITTTTAQNQEYFSSVIAGQIFALAKNAALEEGEVNTATFEAFEQLAGAAGFPPRAVQLPRALREGLTSFFATPKSSGELNLPVLWSGIGGPHWLYLPLFRKMMDARKNGAEKAEIRIHEKTSESHAIKIGGLDLLRVVTDRDFAFAEKADEHDRDFLREKAKADAWALIYFLVQKKGDQFRQFYQELKEMPRDLDLSPEVIEQAFGRSFQLMDAQGEKLDTAKVGRLQDEWTDYMKSVMLEVSNEEKK